MAGGIYLIQDDDRLLEMMEQPYDSEDQLQDLLVTYPNLIAGDQIDRATARKWLLISREVSVPISLGPLIFNHHDATISTDASSQTPDLFGQYVNAIS